MNYISEELGLKIFIKDDLFYSLSKKAEAGCPNESGGLLVGKYSTDNKTVIVTNAVTPTKEITTPTSYTRKTDNMESVWKELYEEGLQYVGEWHSHPKGSPQYSTEDLNAMRGIYADENITISKPLLLILGVKDGEYCKNAAYIYNRDKDELIKFKEMVNLKELFLGLQKQMEMYLVNDRQFIGHSASKGDASENRWISFLSKYLPSRYNVDKAIIIDHNGNVSQQIDVVIYDTFFTPFIFNQDGFKYIPAEAVYAVFEVKQDIKGYIEYAAEKIESVRKLERTSTDMIASGVRMRKRNLTKIIGGILTTSCSTSKEAVKENILKQTGLRSIDCGCCIDSFSFHTTSKNTDNSKCFTQDEIIEFYGKNEYIEVNFEDQERALLLLFLQLFNDLKDNGSVPAIDINAYLRAVDAEIDL